MTSRLGFWLWSPAWQSTWFDMGFNRQQIPLCSCKLLVEYLSIIQDQHERRFALSHLRVWFQIWPRGWWPWLFGWLVLWTGQPEINFAMFFNPDFSVGPFKYICAHRTIQSHRLSIARVFQARNQGWDRETCHISPLSSKFICLHMLWHSELFLVPILDQGIFLYRSRYQICHRLDHSGHRLGSPISYPE